MDSLANMLSTIKNASMVRKSFVEMPYTKKREKVAGVLKEKGFLRAVKIFKFKEKSFKGLHLELAYLEDGEPKLREIKRVSKPGRRIYRKAQELYPLKGGYGLLVVSTSRGIMSGVEARKKHLGGEVICKAW